MRGMESGPYTDRDMACDRIERELPAEDTGVREAAEQTEQLSTGDAAAEWNEFPVYVGMEDVFEANENAESISLGASCDRDARNLERKMDTALRNLEHAQKRLNALLSNRNTPGNLIREREYQVKTYQKEVNQLRREIRRNG